MKTLSRFIATVGFIGFVPFAPGTAGSLVATLAFILMPTYLSPVPFTLASLALLLLAVWAADRYASVDRPDPSEVVIDEVVGLVVTIAYLPLTPLVLILSFVLFRGFDIAKPFPVRQFEKLPGGWGIVLDDVMAGVYANLAVRLLLFWIDTIKI